MDNKNELLHFLQNYLRETSAHRLSSHCRGMAVEHKPWDGKPLVSGSLGERTSAILLWGSAGKITIKTHFRLDTAVAWASIGLDRRVEDVDEFTAIDFFREFSNLHAGFLRGSFEELKMLFGLSLPFIMHGEDEEIAQMVRSSRVRSGAWVLSDGRQSVICTSEIELTDASKFEKARTELEKTMRESSAEKTSEGEVEFF